jgi:hypothetical protein
MLGTSNECSPLIGHPLRVIASRFASQFNASKGYVPLPGVDIPLVPGGELPVDVAERRLMDTGDAAHLPLFANVSGGDVLAHHTIESWNGRELRAGGGPVTSGAGGKPLPRYHFDYFMPAILSVFILTTGNWFHPMVLGIDVIGPAAAAYYILVMVIGTYILVNLFVAILLQLFSVDDDGDGRADAFEVDATKAKPQKAKGVQGTPTHQVARRWSVMKEPSLEDELVDESEDMALGLFGPRDEFRMWCREFIEAERVVNGLMACVIVSSLLLILDNPRLDPGSALAMVLYVINLVFTAIFTVEAILKSVAYGFIFTREAYLSSGWNSLDFTLLCVSIGSILSDILPQLAFLKSLRAFRALRPLRLLSRNPGMKLIIETLLESLPAVGNVFGVVLMLQLVFSILGMQMFSGTFGKCSDPTIMIREACQSDSAASVNTTAVGRALRAGGGQATSQGSSELVWANPAFGSFDDFGQSMLLLLILSSGDNVSSRSVTTHPLSAAH